MVEDWKPIDECPGYEVSNLGRVRSWRPRNGKGVAAEPRLLKLYVKEGYLHVGLSMPDRVVWKTVHSLVAISFIGSRPKSFLCCHEDGNRQNNAVTNLRWGTDQDNKADQLRHGTRAAGDQHYKTRIGRAGAQAIRARLAAGETIKSICRDTGLSTSAVSAIKNNKAWKECIE